MRLALVGLAAWLLVSCGATRYPLVIYNGQTFLESRDRSGDTVVFLVDTGAPQSLLARSWVRKQGGEVRPAGPNAASGFQLFQEWHHRAWNTPIPPGVPSVLDGLPVVDYEKSGFLGWQPGLPGPEVGILGADVLYDAALDFRGDRPELIFGAEPLPRVDGRFRYDLVQQSGHYALHSSFYRTRADGVLEGRNEFSVVDTGCAYAYLAFFPQPPAWPALLHNPRTPLRVNGSPVLFFHTEGFQIETSRPEPFIAAAFDGSANPALNLLGTPFFQTHRAFIDLKRWTFEFEPRARTTEGHGAGLDAAADWAWQAKLGDSIRVVTMVGSTPAKRGVQSGDVVTEVGGESLARPRSVLEWNRVWDRFASERRPKP